MKDGFLKVAAVTPHITVADPVSNSEAIVRLAKETAEAGAKLLVFPELCITGYECRDLFAQNALLAAAKHGLTRIAKETAGLDALLFVGLPMVHAGKLFNCAAAISRGQILGIVPKTFLPNYAEFYEARNFHGALPGISELSFREEGLADPVPFGTDLLFACETMPSLVVAAEICEDLWAPAPPSIHHAIAGATVIVNLSASDEVTGKAAYRRNLVAMHSAQTHSAYLYAAAGEGESTTDLVFGAHNMIAENGTVLAEAPRFENAPAIADLDLDRLMAERRKNTTYPAEDQTGYRVIPFSLAVSETALTRIFPKHPFVPEGAADRAARCEEIFTIQAMGLKQRLSHVHAKCAVIGLSGGLDSTLALLVTLRAFDLLGLPRKEILAVTMPCFGTTDRTYHNACSLAERTGAALLEVNIEKAVRQHFEDIGQSMEAHDVTFENSQARERTQVLMDLANKNGGLVIGTGDLSELALGWATYNGDHMSMYGVNASIPKTLVRHLVRYCADTSKDPALAEILLDILDTPVSPELLPPENGTIAQKTEDLVGPYELHDFFLYYVLRHGFPPEKIYRIAKLSFADSYEDEVILQWLRTFYRRFFSQQYKRSCLPDGPKVGSVAVSPRGDLRMPSDASARVWLSALDCISNENGL